MENVSITRLDLRSPLPFGKIEGIPSKIHINEEILLLFELNPAQSRNIEPLPESLLGSLSAAGCKTLDSHADITLPAGKYIFSQRREPVNADISSMPIPEWLEMAIEQQKDALWERYTPYDCLYVRFLFEDNALVTQLFRPCG